MAGLRQGNGRIYHREALITEKDKWTWNLTVVEILTETIKKSDGQHSSEQRLYFTSLDDRAVKLNMITRRHWSVECLHSEFDRNLRQDSIKKKTERSANNLDTLQQIVLNVISIWKSRRKKVSDKKKGTAQLLRNMAGDFTRLLRFLRQNEFILIFSND